MPQRLTGMVTVDASAVQGDGANVTLRKQTWGERRMFYTLPVTDDPGGFERLADYLRVKVVGWNWVDDGGQPFPLPADDPDVLDRLTDAEITFLLQAAR